jgi:hypothetical protein
MPRECSPITRNLYTWEVHEARRVFASSLAYERVRVHECATWPDTLDRFGRRLKRMDAAIQPNAITIGNHCYFPVRLMENPADLGVPADPRLGWLMHELAHVWQYQRMGWSALLRAIKAQFTLGNQVYDFGGEPGLALAYHIGQRLVDLNPEQQGEICRSYYDRLVRGVDVSAWLPFIEEFQRSE